jgi:hypothetical protein
VYDADEEGSVMIRNVSVIVTFVVFLSGLPQVHAAGVSVFDFPLSGDQLVPPVGTAAGGSCVAVLNATTSTLLLSCVHDLSGGDVIAAHIHGAPAGLNGGVRFSLSSGLSPIKEIFNLSPADAIDLEAGNLYVNIHTATFPAGELRGQLVGGPRATWTFPLDGDQLVPPVTTTATGSCQTHLGTAEDQLAIICDHIVLNPTAAHIHSAPAGLNGGVVYPFASGESPMIDVWNIAAANVATLRDQGFYVNVHSTDFPAGEVRGQMIVGIFTDGFETGDTSVWDSVQ